VVPHKRSAREGIGKAGKIEQISLMGFRQAKGARKKSKRSRRGKPELGGSPTGQKEQVQKI